MLLLGEMATTSFTGNITSILYINYADKLNFLLIRGKPWLNILVNECIKDSTNLQYSFIGNEPGKTIHLLVIIASKNSLMNN